MSMKIYLTNLGKYVEGCLVGQWVELPVPDDKLNDILKQIGINDKYEEFFITDYDGEFSCVSDVLGEYESIETLNELAKALGSLSSYDEDKLNAILEAEDFKGAEDVLNLIERLDDFDFVPNVDCDCDLGLYLINDCGCLDVPDNMKSYIDYEAYGRDARLNGFVTYTSYGCVIDNR